MKYLYWIYKKINNIKKIYKTIIFHFNNKKYNKIE